MIPITQAVLDHAVKLRQSKKMSLGDSLVAGTALTYDLTLVTRNTEDFKWIPNLKLLNPFEGRQPTIANP
jgi:predicted nucleic acid-binding protein